MLMLTLDIDYILLVCSLHKCLVLCKNDYLVIEIFLVFSVNFFLSYFGLFNLFRSFGLHFLLFLDCFLITMFVLLVI